MASTYLDRLTNKRKRILRNSELSLKRQKANVVATLQNKEQQQQLITGKSTLNKKEIIYFGTIISLI